MATTGPRVVKAALKTLLVAKPALSGVKVFTYSAKQEELGREYVIMGNVDADVEPNAMGFSTLSEYTIECLSVVHQPEPDDTADRGWAILDAVAEVLIANYTASGNVLDANLTKWTIDETVDPDGGRRATITFDIGVRDLSA